MNKLSLLRRGLLAGATLAAGGAGLALGAAPAGASSAQVSAVGSFTTYTLMHDLFPTSLNDLLPGGTTVHQVITPTTKLCTGGFTYTATTPVPNGSGAGKVALHNEETAAANEQGCIDFSRSSSPPEPGTATVSTNFDYYAYALDGVAPMVGTNAGTGAGTRAAPIEITLAQMKEIYSCWNGSAVVTTWSQVGLGASTTTINRFWPQAGSGTRAVYTDILGFTPTKVSGTTASNHCTTATVTAFPGGKINEENSEVGMIYANSLGGGTHKNILNDVYVYSSGKFAQQWNTTANFGPGKINKLSGTAIGNFTPTNLRLAQMVNRTTATTTLPFATFTAQVGVFNPATNRGSYTLNQTVIDEANEWYSHMPAATSPPSASTAPVPGVRYVFNVADTALPTYSEAKALVGFDNQGTGAKSALCSGNDDTVIIGAGFVPLSTVGGPTNSNNAGATCREFPGKHYPGHGGDKQWLFNTWVTGTV